MISASCGFGITCRRADNLGGVLMALGGSFALRARIGKQGGAA